MRLEKLVKNAFYFVVVLMASISVAPQLASGQENVCKVGNITYTCPPDFEKLPNVDETTNMFKFQYKDIVVYFFVANPSGKLDHTGIMNTIGSFYNAGGVVPYRWKEMKESPMMSMRSQHERQVTSWLGYDGVHLINVKSAVFKIDDKNVVFGYAWDWSKLDNKESKFKKAADLGDQSIGCNTMATVLNSMTREFPQGRQYCFSTSASLTN